ncbi:hypothetical protein EVJ58_g7527 [Rhodofomes roseus]|nr:hypothetical protein EVJ58_g7527 [Rhodofomes roseus]
MEDLFATPRQKYGPELVDEVAAVAVSSPVRRRRQSNCADPKATHPDSPERYDTSSHDDTLDNTELETSSEYLLASLHAQEPKLLALGTEPWTPKRVLTIATKVLFFLPWCIAVGGAILLSPQHLNLVAFKTGYVSHERGPHRFGYWAECAHQHVVIFLAVLAVGAWWNLRYGTWVVAAMLARCVYVWHDFHVDLTVPLGEDDRQSLYLALTKVYLRDNFVMRVPTKGVESASRLS